MAQGSSMDMSKLSTGEKIVLGGAGAYFVWAFLPFWYRFSIDLGPLGGVSDNLNGLRGITLVAWLLAIIALVEIVLRVMLSTNFSLPVKPGVLHVVVAGIALVFTVLGLATKPTGYGISWGLIVAIIICLAWVYGAYMMYSAPESTPMAPPSDTPAGGFNG